MTATTTRRTAGLLAILVALAATLTLQPAAEAIVIPTGMKGQVGDPPVVCGSILSVPTTLTSDLVCPSTALQIGANGVTLDLNGYTVESIAGAGSGVIVQQGLSDVTILNGTIDGFSYGIFANGPADLTNFVVDGVTVTNAGVDGIRLPQTTNGGVRNSSVSNVGNTAIRVTGSTGVDVTGNTVSGAAAFGIFVQTGSSDVIVQDNEASNSVTGIVISDSGPGIELSGNNAHDNTFGYQLLGGELVASNTATNNSAFGYACNAAVVDGGGNTASGNGTDVAPACGITLDDTIQPVDGTPYGIDGLVYLLPDADVRNLPDLLPTGGDTLVIDRTYFGETGLLIHAPGLSIEQMSIPVSEGDVSAFDATAEGLPGTAYYFPGDMFIPEHPGNFFPGDMFEVVVGDVSVLVSPVTDGNLYFFPGDMFIPDHPDNFSPDLVDLPAEGDQVAFPSPITDGIMHVFSGQSGADIPPGFFDPVAGPWELPSVTGQGFYYPGVDSDFDLDSVLDLTESNIDRDSDALLDYYDNGPTTLIGSIGGVVVDRPLAVRHGERTRFGSGRAYPGSSVAVSLFSDPIPLGGAVADENGDWEIEVTIPDEAQPGSHQLIGTGQALDGGPLTVTIDVVIAEPVVCTIEGTVDDDVLIGTSGDDVICGLEGNDLIFGLGGADIVLAGSGDDLIYAGRGDDVVEGQSGADWLLGGLGDDVLSGGDGDDLLLGGWGDDELDGGPGDDVLIGGAGDDLEIT